MPSEIIYSVFVSSTYEDLREERAAVQKALLQLHCMPIGMELFGAADEETWDFIKRQIEDCDYYVVIVADKYGSADEDGVSYTEKEYDYAREAKKPVLAFVHNDRGNIPRNKAEVDPEKRSKLEAFIQKVQRSPVSFFAAPHDLATQVTVSFVNLRARDRRQEVGFIRASQVPDLKKYTDLLEENAHLKAELAKLNSQQAAGTAFPQASETVTFTARVKQKSGVFGIDQNDINITWKDLFVYIAEYVLTNRNFAHAIDAAIKSKIVPYEDFKLPDWEEVTTRIALRLIGWGLAEYTGSNNLYLTEYGKKQYGLLMR